MTMFHGLLLEFRVLTRLGDAEFKKSDSSPRLLSTPDVKVLAELAVCTM